MTGPTPSHLCVSDFFVSSYTPSLAALSEAQKRQKPLDIRTVKVLAAIQPDSRRRLNKLPSLVQELKQIAAVVPKDNLLYSDDSGQLDFDGSKTTVEKTVEKIKEADIFHLGCHGIKMEALSERDPDQILKAGLALGQTIGKELDRFTIQHLIQLPPLPKANIAVFTTCNSGTSFPIPFEGVTFANAAMMAGFCSVLATML